MPTLTIKNIKGSCSRAKEYGFVWETDIYYIVEPEDSTQFEKIDVLSNPAKLIEDFLETVNRIRYDDEFMKYFNGLIRKWSVDKTPSRANKLYHVCKNEPDYFVDRLDSPVIRAVKFFVSRYGLPRFDILRGRGGAYTQPIKGGEGVCMIACFLLLTAQELAENALQGKASLPGFVECNIQSSDMFSSTLDLEVSPKIENGVLQKLLSSTADFEHVLPNVLPCIYFAALLEGQEGRTIRKCKRCGKFFLPENTRAEYCSPQCRSSYNTAMTRARKKKGSE